LAWTSTYESYYHKFTILQNKAVKIIGGEKWNDRSTPFYAKLKILKFDDLIEFEKTCFIFKHKTQKLPPPFDNYFVPALNAHQRTTRDSGNENMYLPFYKTSKLQRSIKFQGPKLWNALMPSLKK